MKTEDQEMLNRLIESLNKRFGRSFRLYGNEANGTFCIRAVRYDTGNDYLTVHDLAAMLQTDVKSVRRMTEARAQRTAEFPVPFFKLGGKMLRFDRRKIQEWLHNVANSTPTFRATKPKRGRPRKQVTQ